MGKSSATDPASSSMVSLPGIGEAPISMMSSPSRTTETFELCIRNVGDVTGIIHTLQAGATIGIRGPFGRGFPMETFAAKISLSRPAAWGWPRRAP